MSASVSNALKSYKPMIYCTKDKMKTKNVGPFALHPSNRPGVGRISCVCANCGSKKSVFINASKIMAAHEGGFLQFLIPLAAAAVPTLLGKLLGD